MVRGSLAASALSLSARGAFNFDLRSRAGRAVALPTPEPTSLLLISTAGISIVSWLRNTAGAANTLTVAAGTAATPVNTIRPRVLG